MISTKSYLGVSVLLLAMTVWLAYSAALHIEAPYVRATANQLALDNNGSRRDFSVYYSPRLGTILVLARLGGGRAGGIVWRVTTDGGQTALLEKMYETTCFACDESYWQGVIVRDGYLAIGHAMLAGTALAFSGLQAALVILRKRFKEDGFDGLAGIGEE